MAWVDGGGRIEQANARMTALIASSPARATGFDLHQLGRTSVDGGSSGSPVDQVLAGAAVVGTFCVALGASEVGR